MLSIWDNHLLTIKNEAKKGGTGGMGFKIDENTGRTVFHVI